MDALQIAADKLREFVLSPSGQVSPAAGLSKGALVGAIAGCAALLGAATQANADYCYGIPEGEEGKICTFISCDENPYHYWENIYYHSSDYGCRYLGEVCGSC